ncbi:MAG: glycosyl transferase family 1 [Chloroflexota bacterium]|nr:glycosyltransferase [Ardenticatenaceae bacterium]GIK57597.1 MAG: glycosyl transferase family 1 [Chloroflexota bacterium]
MKILFIVPYVPNLIRVRPYNILRSLSARGHQITLLTLVSDQQDQADLEQIKPFCHAVHAVQMSKKDSIVNCLKVIPSHTPFQSVYSWQPALLKLAGNLDTYDVVHVEHLRGVQYGLALKQQVHLPVVWDSVDCITHLFRQAVAKSDDFVRRWRSRLDLRRTEWFEGWAINQFDHVLVTSKVDKMHLLALDNQPHTSTAPITVLPNGVDFSYFQPNPAAPTDTNTLVVTGKMSYHANISMTLHLVHEIMPRVWQHNPAVKLLIVGKDPTPEIAELNQHPAITVTGTVPDIPPYLHQATLAVAPITYNAGIQNKILEAMACGTAVVTTSQAISSLNIQPEREIAIADTPEDFSQAILKLLQDEQMRQEMAIAGYTYVRNHHNWDTIAYNLESIYTDTIHAKKYHTRTQPSQVQSLLLS